MRTNFKLLGLCLLLTLSGYGQRPTNGLIGYWPFNGNANDASGNGNNGVVHGATLTSDRFGNPNVAYSFNGVSNYILVNNSATFPDTAITISFWFNRRGNTLTALEQYLSKELAFGTYLLQDSSIAFQVWKGSPGIWTSWESLPYKVQPDTNWVFYAFTYSNATKVANIYINGNLVNSIVETDPNGILRTSAYPMYIGRNGSASVYYIKGDMDDISIYNRVLSKPQIDSLYYDGVCQVPAQPGLISALSPVCPNSAEVFSVSPVTGAISYIWSVPQGWSVSDTTATATISVGGNSGTVSVVAKNSCGTSVAKTLYVNVGPALGQLGPISGNGVVCTGTTTNFSIFSVVGATGYIWQWKGSGQLSGSGTSVSLSPTTSDTLKVSAYNSCDTSSASSRYINVLNGPPQPGAIIGLDSVCEGQTYTYYAPGGPGAVFSWTMLASWQRTILGDSVSITFSGQSGNLTAIGGINSCGGGTNQSKWITVLSKPALTVPIAGPDSICAGLTVSYSLPTLPGLHYHWEIPPTWNPQINAGTITLTPLLGSDTVKVCVYNDCDTSGWLKRYVEVMDKPGEPIAISGPVSVKKGSPATYSINPVQFADTYYWTAPRGWSRLTNATTVSIPINVSGNICVVAQNKLCGQSDSTCLWVTADTNNIGMEEDGTVETSFELFPNPSTGEVTVRMGNKGMVKDIEIFNSAGRRLQVLNAIYQREKTFKLPYEKGVYLIVVKTLDNARFYRRVIRN